MAQTLHRATPESVGIASGVLVAWIDELERTVFDTHSLMVLRHGKVVAEGWWAPNSAELNQKLFSLSKSFTSTAVGLAVAEGRFGLDDAVVSFFPDDAPATIGPNLAAMKVRHLLAMCTGHTEAQVNGRIGFEGENWVGLFLAQPVEDVPGSHFVYNTAATYMLSAIIQRTTGQKLVDYLGPRLFEPLGVANPIWEECPRGINTGGYGLEIRTEDIARFGQLYLQKGVWGGRQLIPAEWVEAATSIQIDNSPNDLADWAQGYGYQFWRGRHGSYRGDGAFGQYCLVLPDEDVVVAITAGTEWMHRILDSVWKVLLPGLKSSPLPEDAAAHGALEERLRGLRLDPKGGPAASELEAGLSGVVFRAGTNPFAIASIRFEFTPAGGTMVCERDGAPTDRLEFGRSAWREGASTLGPDWLGRPLVASATWPRPDLLEIEVFLYATPFRFTLGCDFADGELSLAPRVNVAMGPTELGAVVATREAGGVAGR